jgi:pyruvate,orthophosphate dikinase
VEIPQPAPPEAAADAMPQDDAPSPGIAYATDAADLLRTLLVKGMASGDHLAEALGCEPATVGALFATTQAEGLADGSAAGYRLTPEGRLAALTVFARDAERFGPDLAAKLFEAFHPLDLRMKDTVTAWQLRDAGEPAVLNDHADAAYDAMVLDRLEAIHADVVTWMAPLADAFDRYGRYRARLAEALRLARAGDQRFVASPRVDSYHSVWFELHEDLIRLAGRRRSDEAANG